MCTQHDVAKHLMALVRGLYVARRRLPTLAYLERYSSNERPHVTGWYCKADAAAPAMPNRDSVARMCAKPTLNTQPRPERCSDRRGLQPQVPQLGARSRRHFSFCGQDTSSRVPIEADIELIFLGDGMTSPPKPKQRTNTFLRKVQAPIPAPTTKRTPTTSSS